jgi:hypothetical protein
LQLTNPFCHAGWQAPIGAPARLSADAENRSFLDVVIAMS